jgi:nucleotide-binding universal stress UspA family protein
MFEKLKEKLRNIRRKKDELTESYDRVMEAATFAQAGEHEHARSAMAVETAEAEAKGPGKILVVGNEYTFSDQLMDYATDMAKRMGRDIVALNATESDLRFRFMHIYRQTVRDDFRLHAEKSAEAFKNKAEQKGVGFEHLVKFGNPDHATEVICQELSSGTTYVLIEPEFENEEAAAGIGAGYDIPVFCVNSHATH